MIDANESKTGISKRFMEALRCYCTTNLQIDKVVLFGSRARGDYHTFSDIDLAVYTKTDVATEQNLIAQALYEMPTPLKMDVVFMNRLKKEKLVANIEREGEVLYEQGKTV